MPLICLTFHFGRPLDYVTSNHLRDQVRPKMMSFCHNTRVSCVCAGASHAFPLRNAIRSMNQMIFFFSLSPLSLFFFYLIFSRLSLLSAYWKTVKSIWRMLKFKSPPFLFPSFFSSSYCSHTLFSSFPRRCYSTAHVCLNFLSLFLSLSLSLSLFSWFCFSRANLRFSLGGCFIQRFFFIHFFFSSSKPNDKYCRRSSLL